MLFLPPLLAALACARAGPRLDAGTSAGSLREAACARQIRIGAAVQAEPLLRDSLYAELVRREFDVLTTENALKFEPLRPAPGVYDFAAADSIVSFAERNGIVVRGHTLVWKRQLPDWLTSAALDREQLIAILREHVRTVVGRYRGRVAVWDVVNEAVQLRGAEARGDSLRPTFWRRIIGPDYVELAFRFAHEADPGARLFYNDGVGSGGGRKADAVHDLVRGLLEDGVPVHGVGLQMHARIEAPPDTAALGRTMRRLADLGLEIHVTEMDVATAEVAGTTEEKLRRQAEVYAQVLATCLSVPRCTTFVTWGVTDRYTWLHPDTPLLFDAAYRPKPAHRALLETLSRAR